MRTTPASMTAPWWAMARPEPRVLLDQQDRPPAAFSSRDRLEDRVPPGVKPGRRFVHQHEHRVEHQRSGDLDDLLLPARQRAGVGVPALRDDREPLGNVLGRVGPSRGRGG